MASPKSTSAGDAPRYNLRSRSNRPNPIDENPADIAPPSPNSPTSPNDHSTSSVSPREARRLSRTAGIGRRTTVPAAAPEDIERSSLEPATPVIVEPIRTDSTQTASSLLPSASVAPRSLDLSTLPNEPVSIHQPIVSREPTSSSVRRTSSPFYPTACARQSVPLFTTV